MLRADVICLFLHLIDSAQCTRTCQPIQISSTRVVGEHGSTAQHSRRLQTSMQIVGNEEREQRFSCWKPRWGGMPSVGKKETCPKNTQERRQRLTAAGVRAAATATMMDPCRFVSLDAPCRLARARSAKDSGSGGEGGSMEESSGHGLLAAASSSSVCNSSAPGRPVTLFASLCHFLSRCPLTDRISLFMLSGSQALSRLPHLQRDIIWPGQRGSDFG